MMGCIYSTYGGGERRGIYRVMVRNLKGRDHLEDLGVVVRVILKIDIQEVGWEGGVLETGLIWLKKRDRLLTFVNKVMNLKVP
jgi:hypothetical protein